ncbi:uncharacterized protein LOC105691587 isoform X1 [Athalia rosae]|uniref:uncharacterized protein LOC105691587 isoform X1 n=1 Tax=Athalia rosae TaxID=37344 RepID=UPI0020345B76|nr:uncharacterized protein LOC105691587 isoform X1 [Athalia rosae]XP_048516177.1 uncharacterized protein LOC105691587 isoform X1 [Athalia rosae]XP_048516178.1 uncharacterized protein LOC105691587 isoform X1 [Athalia rosae]
MITDNGEYADYLRFPDSSWKRPEGPARVWRVVEGRKKLADGKIPKFSIQEVPVELEQDVVDFMTRYFVPDEVICASLDLINDPPALREMRSFWKKLLSQGISVVALQENSDPVAKPVIAGANILSVSTLADAGNRDKGTPFRSDALKKLVSIIEELEHEADVLNKFNVDRYLNALGLCVHPSFRGQGLGDEILRTRDAIGLAYQIPVSGTVFTGPASQLVASRVGFQVSIERKYREILDEAGNPVLPRVKCDYIKLMVKKLYRS